MLVSIFIIKASLIIAISKNFYISFFINKNNLFDLINGLLTKKPFNVILLLLSFTLINSKSILFFLKYFINIFLLLSIINSNLTKSIYQLYNNEY